ncbi:MAG: Wzz/FepE/Etk N-terminal domain-containing protein, partial [Bacteroidota bacterium]
MHPSAAPDPSAQPSQPEEVSLVDVVLALARHRRLIVGMTVGGVVVGLMLALLSTPVYTASATLVRETESSEGLSGLGGFSMLRGLGINLGMSSTGLTPQAYPDIVRSREVRLAVVRDTFYIPPEGRVL